MQYGPDREVYFEQAPVPGREAAFDFTDLSDLGVTLRGVAFPHLLFDSPRPTRGWWPRRPRPSPCWKRSTSCAATARRGRPASCGRTRGGAGCCAPNPITASGETAVLFHLRDAFRAGDVWLARSRRYGDIRRTLLSAPAGADADRSLPVPVSPHDWLAERRFALDEGMRRLAAAARAGAIAGGSIEDKRAPRREDGNRRAGRGRRPGRRPLPADARGTDHRHLAQGGRRHPVHRGLHAPANRGALPRPHRSAQRAARRGRQPRSAQDDPRRPERVAARRGREPRGRGAPLDHRQDHPALERPPRQPAPRRVHALEEGPAFGSSSSPAST